MPLDQIVDIMNHNYGLPASTNSKRDIEEVLVMNTQTGS